MVRYSLFVLKMPLNTKPINLALLIVTNTEFLSVLDLWK